METTTLNTHKPIDKKSYLIEVQAKVDKIIDRFVIVFFILGFCFAPIYSTWTFSLAIGSFTVLIYLLARFVITNKFISRMIISVVLAMFVLQYIGQVHGMAELHFFFFTNIALLILYQDWRLIMPYTIVTVAHHSLLAFFQIYLGNPELGLYFISYTNITFLQMAFHFGIVSLMAYIAILWSVMLQKNSTKLFEMQELTIRQNQQLLFSEAQLQEALINTEKEIQRQTIDLQRQTEELQANEEELRQNLEELNIMQEKLIVTQEEERKSNEVFKALFEYSTNPHLLFDETGIIDCNNATLKILGYSSKNEVLKLHPAKLSPEKQADGILSSEKAVIMDSIAKEQGYHRFEWIHRKSDGTDFPVEVTLNPIKLDNKNVLLVVWHDLTERKQVEYKIQQQTEELQANEEELRQNLEELSATQEILAAQKVIIEEKEINLRALIDNTKDSIFSLDRSYCFITANNTVIQQYGAAGIKIEKGVCVLDLAPSAEVRAVFKSLYDRALAGEDVKVEQDYSDIKNGIVAFFELVISPIKNIHNNIIGCSVSARDITEHKKSEAKIKAQNEALQASQEELLVAYENSRLLEILIDNSPDAVQAAEDNGKLIYMNQLGLSRLGLTKEQMLSMYVRDFEKAFTEDGTWEAHVADMKAMKELTIQSVNHDKANHRDFPVEVSIKHVEIGDKGYLVAISKDITERKKAEAEIQAQNEELQANQEELKQNLEELSATQDVLEVQKVLIEEKEINLRALIDNTKDSIFSLDTSYCFITANNTVIQQYGAAGVKIEKGLCVLDLAPSAEVRAVFKSLYDRALAGEEVKAEQDYSDIKNGIVAFFELLISPMKNINGNIIGCSVSARDITERKQAEIEIKQLSLVAQKTNSAIIITDKNGITTWVNNAFTTISGYSFEEAIGKKPGALLQGKDTNPEHRQKLRIGLDSKKPFIQEILNYRKDSTPYWLSLSVTPIFDEAGELYQFIGVKTDITDMKNQKAVVDNALLELSAKKELIEEQNKELHTQEEEIRQNMEELVATQDQLQIQFGELSAKNKNISDSITYAKRIQTALLPRLSEIQKVFPESFVLFRPKDVISGDFYWFANKTEYNLQILIAADCTGHGVPGAFMSMLGSSLLSNIIHDREIHEPNKILDSLHISVEEMLNQRQEDNTNRDGMDATICVIDRNKNCIHYAGANNSLYVISQNPLNFVVGGDETKKQITVLETENWLLTELKADKKPVGGRVIKQDDLTYHFQTFEMNQELRLYLSSDGFTDQIGGENRKKLMSKNFKQLLIENHEKPYQEQKDAFNDFFENWISYFDNKQLDDMMLLGVKVNK
jgi:PAS domain S-box-containing protein